MKKVMGRRPGSGGSRGRKPIAAVEVIEAGAAVNIVTCIAALVSGDRSIGLITGLIAASLMGAVVLLARIHDGDARAEATAVSREGRSRIG